MGNFKLDDSPLSTRKRPTQKFLHLDGAPLRVGGLRKLGYATKHELAEELKRALRAAQAAQVEAGWQGSKPDRVEKIASAIFLQNQIHLLGWIEKIDEAINDAQEPSDKNSRVWWGISLVGNLIWAATSLNSIGQVAKVAMSFAGAALGSGVAEKVRDAVFNTPQGRKETIKRKIAELQGVFEDEFQKKRFDWAGEFDAKRVLAGVGYEEALSAFVWGKMFAIPYHSGEGRFHQVYVKAKANIEKILGKFRDEWEKWQEGNKLINLSDGLGPSIHVKQPSYKPNFEPDLQPVWEEMEKRFDLNRPLA